MTSELIALAVALALPAQGAPMPASAHPVDGHLEAAWKELGVTPAATASDDAFLRRASLDLIGRIPTPAEVIAFRAAPDRTAMVDRLLASPAFDRFWSEVATATLVGHSADDAFGMDREALRAWLQEQLARRTPHDQTARALLTAEGSAAEVGPASFLIRHQEEPAVKVSRLFLGIRLDCARCHDHPFDRWKRDDFDRLSRFFEPMEVTELSPGNSGIRDSAPGDVPREERPRFLNGAVPVSGRWRQELALQITRSRSFARAFANRVWYQLMGRGLVHPVDDLNRQNPPVSPALMEALADHARASRFDVRSLVRLIATSRAYGLASALPSGADRVLSEEAFAVRILRPLTPEQRVDSMALALGQTLTPKARSEAIAAEVGEAFDVDFSTTWDDRQTTQQLMDRLAAGVPDPEAPLDTIYLRVLGRDPTERERALCAGRPPRDVLFALLHSSEFAFNH
jgi:hypothetical protein